MKHWLFIAYCVCSTGSWVATDTSMDALAEKTVQRTDAAFKSRELTLQQEVETLEDQLWVLKGIIESIENRGRNR